METFKNQKLHFSALKKVQGRENVSFTILYDASSDVHFPLEYLMYSKSASAEYDPRKSVKL